MPLIFPTVDASAATGFGINPLDRRSEARGNEATVAAALADPAARHHLFAGPLALLAETDDGVAADCDARTAARFGAGESGTTVLLGWDDDGLPHVATELAALGEAAPPAGFAALDLRTLVVDGLLPPPQLGIRAQAASLLAWHRSHRFCAACGTASMMRIGGYRRDCPACGTQHFPRTDPVVIMLAIDGDRCLLGRQARFAPGMYSCLAGFLEPGETMEDAVRRELFEEAGIRTGAVLYRATQPWPFPMSLMIGCYAEALTTDLTVDFGELEACRWFERDEVAAMVEDRHPDGLRMPPGPTIARHILSHWLAEG